jgi:hypothetical protein
MASIQDIITELDEIDHGINCNKKRIEDAFDQMDEHLDTCNMKRREFLRCEFKKVLRMLSDRDMASLKT